jgi:excisionase family DNA binding protein
LEVARGINPMASDPEVLTVKEVCKLLQLHQSTVYKLIKEGKIPVFRIGSDWRFRTDLIMRWMDEHSLLSREFDIDPQTEFEIDPQAPRGPKR